MQGTSLGTVAVFPAVGCAPELSRVLHSIAFRIRAAGKADLARARRQTGGRAADGARRGRHG
ncbi:hypothetical protein GCM10010260_58700 [Streptomyces filipinensis]|uniref:Uncharacterized protein n=1 Tax=Streptomyces filipinensis TaxID=66887 RepID=A0A918IGS6_9ACTN|nr:hypothetical protein GCM10010260_58700 [Streptomyces filipinensis]